MSEITKPGKDGKRVTVSPLLRWYVKNGQSPVLQQGVLSEGVNGKRELTWETVEVVDA